MVPRGRLLCTISFDRYSFDELNSILEHIRENKDNLWEKINEYTVRVQCATNNEIYLNLNDIC